MLGNFAFSICVLIALAVAGYSQICEYQWFKCENTTEPFVCKSESHPGWIPRSQLCEGHQDCSDGSDESIRTCKLHPMYTGDDTFCVSGGIILSEKICNRVVDCLDGTDEMGCKEIKVEDYRGNCGESMVKCKRESKCIESTKLCDKTYDCNDGWDESLQMCFKNCESGQFQCGNGACIEPNLVCDSKLDCLDGADELPNVCMHVPNYIPMPSINCTVPKHRDLLSYDDTIPHIKGEAKYYLPHEIMHLKCPSYKRPIGSVWNVCNTTGQWQFPMLRCISDKKKN